MTETTHELLLPPTNDHGDEDLAPERTIVKDSKGEESKTNHHHITPLPWGHGQQEEGADVEEGLQHQPLRQQCRGDHKDSKERDSNQRDRSGAHASRMTTHPPAHPAFCMGVVFFIFIFILFMIMPSPLPTFYVGVGFFFLFFITVVLPSHGEGILFC
jgi:hypothetical protein